MNLVRGLLLLLLLSATPVGAQDPNPRLPDLPAGPATIRGAVVHNDGPRASANLPVTLYALTPDGQPGAREARTDATGAFSFEGLSNRPGVVYLLGVRHSEVPFGRRVVFSAGQTDVTVTIPISDPTPDPSALRVVETTIRFDWSGARLEVEETHRVVNTGNQVGYVGREQQATSKGLFTATLPEQVTGFKAAQGMHGEGLERRGSELLHWGPFYPGENEVRYQYARPLLGAALQDAVPLRGVLASGAERLVVLVPEGDESLTFPGLTAGESVERDGRRYRSWVAEGLKAGASYAGAVRVPASTNDPSAIGSVRADVWIELDDAAVVVSQELRVVVEGEQRLAGSPEAPLLRFELPDGAELLGLTQGAAAVGFGSGTDGTIALLGPLPPGESHFGFRYRIPARGQTVPVLLRFPVEIATLHVMVADTGVRVTDERLHRLRPTQSGTRMYLRREGFHIQPQEAILLKLTALSPRSTPRWASLSVILLTALGGAAFLFRPLGRAPELEPVQEPSGAIWAREREAVYDSIRDLEDDFETGKVSKVDHERMRAELRARAVGLLRLERAEPAPTEPSAEIQTGEVRTGGFCPGCGKKVLPSWRFCSHCGGPLSPTEAA